MATINNATQNQYSYAYAPRLLDRTTPERRLENTDTTNSPTNLQAIRERENQLSEARYTRQQTEEQLSVRRVQQTLELQLANTTRTNNTVQDRNLGEQNRLRHNEAEAINENNYSPTRQINGNPAYQRREPQALSQLGGTDLATERENARNQANNLSRANNRETTESAQTQAAQETQARNASQQAVAEYQNNQALLQTSNPSRISDLI